MSWPDFTYSLNPTWPDWLPESAALPALLGAAALLAVLTLWTYLGARGARPGRIGVVLLLRLAALAVALLVALRPSFGVQVLEGLEPSKLLIVIDASESMNVPDEFNSLSRWDNARRILAARPVVDALKRLAADEQIEVVYYQAAEALAPFDAQGVAQGKRTDVGGWLHELHQKHAGQDKLRGVLIFSDGADNGTRFPVLDEARRWKGVCPLYTFGLGKPQQDEQHKDVIVAGVRAAPSPVPAKTKLTITGLVHAPGFQNARVKVGVWVQGTRAKEPTQLGASEQHALKDEKNNEIVLVRDAPEEPDEYKVTLKVEKVAGEADDTNNEASTYVQVTKDGIRVLWVEGRKRPYEPIYAQRALARDKRFRVYRVEAAGKLRDGYEFDKRHYDVIVIGDLSARQFDGGDAAVLAKVVELVKEQKVGLMMLGGIDTFGQGGWDKTPLTAVLPVTLDSKEQLDKPVRVHPTEGAGPYPFMKLDDDPTKNKELWKKLQPLDGVALLGKASPTATVLARASQEKDGEPLLVAGQHGGRVLVFGGDTTWKAWLRPGTVAAYDKFWRQAILWLANQDDRAGNLWIDLKTRRVSAGGPERLDFTFGLKGKTGLDVARAEYEVKATGPAGAVISVPRFGPEKKHQRGYLPAPTTPGEYLLQISGKGKDVDGGEVSDTKAVRFLVVAEDLELQRKAADHDLLTDLANASGGKFVPADETRLLELLGDLKGQVRKESHAKTVRWPDWDRHPATDAWNDQLAGLWGSGAVLWFLAFAALLGGEWGLRRMWGMV